MILTEQAKEDFYIWFVEGSNNPNINTNWLFKKEYETITIALVMDWFDSIEMYFWVYRSESGYWATSIERKAKYDTRNEALKSAIEYANEIYNNNEQRN